MKIALNAFAAILLIACACVSNNSPLPLTKMTDEDLNRLVEQKHSFDQMRSLLGLQNAEYHTMENGSTEQAAYRFTVGNRSLFLETIQNDKLVTGAFFSTNSNSPHFQSPATGPSGEVLKPN